MRLGFACLIATCLLAAPAAAEIGRVKTVAGEARITRGAATSVITPGAKVQARDVIETGRDGRVGLIFIDNSRFALGPNGRIALSEFEFDDATHVGRSLVTINHGALAVVSGQIAKENKDAMRVRTPTSVLAARGTRFVVEVK